VGMRAGGGPPGGGGKPVIINQVREGKKKPKPAWTRKKTRLSVQWQTSSREYKAKIVSRCV